MYFVLYFLAGMFVANAAPHFIKGVTGEEFRTPFKRPSPAWVNVLWAGLNLLVAWGLWHYAGMHRSLTHSIRYDLTFAIGGLVMSLALAWIFASEQTRRGAK